LKKIIIWYGYGTDLRRRQPSKYGRQRHCTACTAHHMHGVSLSVDFSHYQV
jgi:hypothetical protein